MIGDFFLGVAMVLMFTIPVLQVARAVENNTEHGSKDLYRIIKYNLIVSSLIILSGFIGLVVYTSFFLDYDNQPFYQQSADIAVNLDLFVIVNLVHVMDSGWIPERVRKHLRTSKTGKTSEKPDNTAGKHVPGSNNTPVVSKSVKNPFQRLFARKGNSSSKLSSQVGVSKGSAETGEFFVDGCPNYEEASKQGFNWTR